MNYDFPAARFRTTFVVVCKAHVPLCSLAVCDARSHQVRLEKLARGAIETLFMTSAGALGVNPAAHAGLAFGTFRDVQMLVQFIHRLCRGRRGHGVFEWAQNEPMNQEALLERVVDVHMKKEADKRARATADKASKGAKNSGDARSAEDVAASKDAFKAAAELACSEKEEANERRLQDLHRCADAVCIRYKLARMCNPAAVTPHCDTSPDHVGAACSVCVAALVGVKRIHVCPDESLCQELFDVLRCAFGPLSKKADHGGPVFRDVVAALKGSTRWQA
jgi:hypothetical protein